MVIRLAKNQQAVMGIPLNRSYTKSESDNKYNQISGSLDIAIKSVNETYQILETDCVIKASGTFTVTLPSASRAGMNYIIKNISSGVITLATTGGQTIDGASTVEILLQESVSVISDGSNWIII